MFTSERAIRGPFATDFGERPVEFGDRSFQIEDSSEYGNVVNRSREAENERTGHISMVRYMKDAACELGTATRTDDHAAGS